MAVIEIEFINVKPKPERLRFFISQFGIEADYEFFCQRSSSGIFEVKSEFNIRGGVLTKMIPIESFREKLVLSEDTGRVLVRETAFKSGEIKRQQSDWKELRLPSTAETPWVLEAVWKELVGAPTKRAKFGFFDGKSAVTGGLQSIEAGRDLGSGTAKLVVDSTKRFEADLEFVDLRLQQLTVEMPVIGKLRLNRRDG